MPRRSRPTRPTDRPTTGNGPPSSRRTTWARRSKWPNKIAQQFSDSRQAWFVLGYTQEAQRRPEVRRPRATSKSLALPQIPAAGGTAITDAAIQQRLDLVSYVTAITDPRLAIAAAVNEVNTALQGTHSRPRLAVERRHPGDDGPHDQHRRTGQRITPPAYFVAFHSGMLAAYGSLESACDAAGDRGLLLRRDRAHVRPEGPQRRDRRLQPERRGGDLADQRLLRSGTAHRAGSVGLSRIVCTPA